MDVVTWMSLITQGGNRWDGLVYMKCKTNKKEGMKVSRDGGHSAASRRISSTSECLRELREAGRYNTLARAFHWKPPHGRQNDTVYFEFSELNDGTKIGEINWRIENSPA